MKYLFNDYMKFLKESVEDEKFSEEVREFFSNLPYGKFLKEGSEEIFKIDIDSIKKIGDYVVRVYSEGPDKIGITFSLESTEHDLVTLFESPTISTSDNDYKKYFKKFINTVTKIVTDLSTLS